MLAEFVSPCSREAFADGLLARSWLCRNVAHGLHRFLTPRP